MTKLEMPIEEFARAVAKENERLRKAAQWRTIDTAPLDGTRILLAMQPELNCYSVQIGYAAKTSMWGLCWRFDGEYTVEAPAGATHWMPLPEPPSADD